MKKNIGILALAMTATGFAASANAAGGYIFGDVGRSDFDLGSGGSGFSVDDTDTSYTLGLGYRFNDYFSAEIGYADLGAASVSTDGPTSGDVLGINGTLNGDISADATGFLYGVRGNLPVTESFNLFARLGMLHWQSDADVDLTVDGTNINGSAELDNGTDPYVGLGADYFFNDSISVNAQWNRYMLDVANEDVDIDTLSLGVAFHF
ncbi:porin family protein [Marinobacterium sp. YM272]|uniref:porin family protein n=1 Tax=Marinobacterium sp. YM272 TaxID=3421654 RepID=UPI003D7F36F8